LTIKRNNANNGWVLEQSFPLYPPGGGIEPWLKTSGTNFCKATVAATDYVWVNGSHKTQHSNSAAAGTVPVVENIAEGTLSTNDVSGTYALASYAQTIARQTDYSGNWSNTAALRVLPHYNTAGILPAGMPSGVTGKRHAGLVLQSMRYTDSKHWGGFIFGSYSGALYNGVWGFFDEYGNYLNKRASGNLGEQRDTGTASFTVTDNTAQVALAGSGTITITLPQVPFDGQELTIFLETAYTGITLSGGALASTIIGGTIGVTAGAFARFSYRAGSNAWRRCG
jgi:hypothetical protein